MLKDGKVLDLSHEGAYSRCGENVDDLVRELGLSPFSPDSSAASDFDGGVSIQTLIVTVSANEVEHTDVPVSASATVVRAESIEIVAVSIGVSDPHGSNVGTPVAKELTSSKAGNVSEVSEVETPRRRLPPLMVRRSPRPCPLSLSLCFGFRHDAWMVFTTSLYFAYVGFEPVA